MKSRNLIILAIIVAVLGAYVLLYERHQLTTEEVAERSGKVFPDLDRDQVVAVDILNAHGEFRIEKRGDGWRLVSPIDFPAEETAVGSLLSSVSNLEEQRRLEAGEVEPSAYGLDQPEVTVTLRTDDGQAFGLRVGNKTPLGSNRAIQLVNDAGIILTSEWFVNDIDKGLDDWRSRELVDVTAGDVASIQVTTAQDRIHAVRDGDLWRLLEPLEDLADQEHLRSLVSDINGIRIEEFVDDAVDPAELGLDAPEYRVTFVRSDGADPIRLDFGSTIEEESGNRVACRRGDDEYFWVSDGAATRLAKAPVRWRSTKAHSFDTWDAEALTITTPESEVTIGRKDGLWTLDDGGELDYTAVQDRLRALADLEAIEFDLMGPLTERMGTVELALKSDSVDGQGGPAPVTYAFYRPLAEGGDAIATVSNRATVMSVDSEKVAEILADPGSLRKPEPLPAPEQGIGTDFGTEIEPDSGEAPE